MGAIIDRVLILSFEHQAWWRGGHAGYTGDITNAGRYPLDEALDIVTRANINRVAEAIVVPPDSLPTQRLPMRVAASDYP
jgi:hypothetical protein